MRRDGTSQLRAITIRDGDRTEEQYADDDDRDGPRGVSRAPPWRVVEAVARLRLARRRRCGRGGGVERAVRCSRRGRARVSASAASKDPPRRSGGATCGVDGSTRGGAAARSGTSGRPCDVQNCLEVLATGGDERVARGQAGRRDPVRAPIAGLGVGQLAGHLADDREVVQGLGDLVTRGARGRLLQGERLSQQPFSRLRRRRGRRPVRRR